MEEALDLVIKLLDQKRDKETEQTFVHINNKRPFNKRIKEGERKMAGEGLPDIEDPRRKGRSSWRRRLKNFKEKPCFSHIFV